MTNSSNAGAVSESWHQAGSAMIMTGVFVGSALLIHFIVYMTTDLSTRLNGATIYTATPNVILWSLAAVLPSMLFWCSTIVGWEVWVTKSAPLAAIASLIACVGAYLVLIAFISWLAAVKGGGISIICTIVMHLTPLPSAPRVMVSVDEAEALPGWESDRQREKRLEEVQEDGAASEYQGSVAAHPQFPPSPLGAQYSQPNLQRGSMGFALRIPSRSRSQVYPMNVLPNQMRMPSMPYQPIPLMMAGDSFASQQQYAPALTPTGMSFNVGVHPSQNSMPYLPYPPTNLAAMPPSPMQQRMQSALFQRRGSFDNTYRIHNPEFDSEPLALMDLEDSAPQPRLPPNPGSSQPRLPPGRC